ncbi:hypothetical protein CALVIDRAFT_540283 [Calocera viscosa TUFC12733]|uniref:Uncharacterized protein n=1 Tax=Calocera viscosa (strain TUFC12733) TaxID=1330018 RepID=A0A167IWM5_CALVF|nr:hypothetical protein CALVIDRAFT_540283 [Calocera viscosa TUFC12733]
MSIPRIKRRSRPTTFEQYCHLRFFSRALRSVFPIRDTCPNQEAHAQYGARSCCYSQRAGGPVTVRGWLRGKMIEGNMMMIALSSACVLARFSRRDRPAAV